MSKSGSAALKRAWATLRACLFGVLFVVGSFALPAQAQAQITVSATLPPSDAGDSYDTNFAASGGTAPYSYSVIAGAVPAGMTVQADGRFSGTPTTAGTYNFTVQAVDSLGATGSSPFSLTITPRLTFSPSPFTAGTVGVAYNRTITFSGGTAPYTLSIPFGQPIPAGLTLTNFGGFARLQGTPTQAGVYNLFVEIRDFAGRSRISQTSITINPPAGITLTPTALASTVAAQPYSAQLSASGGTAPYSYAVTAGAVPAGLNLSGAGLLSGTPTTPGSYNFTVTATDSINATGARAYTLVVSAPTLVLFPPSLPAGAVGGAYNQTLSSSGGTGPYQYALVSGALPIGMSLSSAGVLSGTPRNDGTFSLSIRSTDANGYSVTAAYPLTISPPTISVTPAVLPQATSNVAYSQTLSAMGGIAPYTWSISAGALPVGLAFSSSGELSGTPTIPGSYNFTVRTTDDAGYVSNRAYTLSVASPPITLSPSTLPAGVRGSSYSQTLSASGGVGPYTYSILGGALPVGLNLSGAGVLSGIPTQTGSTMVVIRVTDANGAVGGQTYSLMIDAASISISPGALPDAVAGVSYSQTITAAGGTGPYQFTLDTGSLPPGVTLAASGLLSGTPIAAGTYSLSIRATDAFGNVTAQPYQLRVIAPVVISIAPPPVFPIGGSPYSAPLTATGGTGPYTFSLTAGALPPGLGLASDGLISGIPTAMGNFPVTVQAVDANGVVGSRSLILSVAGPAPALLPNSLPSGTAGTAYSQSLNSTGLTAPVTWAITSGALPTGMTLSPAGVLAGTPALAGDFTFGVRATDTYGFIGARPMTLRIEAPSISLAPGSVPATVAGAAYSQTFVASGGVGPYAFSISGGALPSGLTLSSAGVLSGVPSQAGTFGFTVRAADANGFPASQAYSLVVTAPSISLSPTSLPGGAAGVAYNQSLTAAGGTGPYVFTVATGALPAGMTLSPSGVLAGTPVEAGAFTFGVRATDAYGFTGSQSVTLQIQAPSISIAPGALPAVVAGSAYNQAFVASGGVGPYAFAIVSGALPAGLTLSGDGVLSGAPLQAGTFDFTVRATDANGFPASRAYSLVVTAPTLTLSPTSLPGGTTGIAYSQSLSAAGGTGPYVFTIAAGTLPAGLTMTTAGVISGIPTAVGSASFTARASDANGFSVQSALTIVVGPSAVTATPITVEILQGQSTTVDLTTGANGGPFTGATLVSLTPASLGEAVISNPSAGQYGLTITPASTFSGRLTATYTLSNASSTSSPGTVTVVVTARPDPAADAEVTGLIAAQGETARRFAGSQIENLSNRLDDLRTGGGGTSRLNLGFSGGSQEFDYGLDPALRRAHEDRVADMGFMHGASSLAGQMEARGDMDRTGFTGGQGGAIREGRWGVWASGGVDFGRRDADSSQEGAKFTTSGLTAGADYRIDETLVLGMAAGYGRDASRIGGNGTRSEGSGYSLSGYGSFRPSAAFFIDGALGYGVLDLTSRRFVTANGLTATGDRDADQWFGSVRIGTELERGAWRLSPFGRLSASRSVLEAFSEQGGGIYSLAYDEQVTRTTTGGVGLLMDNARELGRRWLTTRIRLEYAHDFQDAASAGLSYADWVNGPDYRGGVSPSGSDRFMGAVGLKLLEENGVTFGLDYQLGLASGLEQHQIRLLIQAPF